VTTATWTTGSLHGSDANFRTWGSEFAAQLAAVGLTQTADTGQVNWTTVTRPGASTDAGYEIWEFTDTQQSASPSSPIFLKFYYGTGTGTTNPRIRVEVGTGSNGSGTLTGTGSGTVINGNHAYGAGTSTATPSYMCHADGIFWYCWKNGSGHAGMFVVARTCDADGDPDGDGIFIWSYGSINSNAAWIHNSRMVRLAATAAVVFSNLNSITAYATSLVPGVISPSTLPSGDKQAYIVWTSNPDMRPIGSLAAVLNSELPVYTTFSTAMVGATSHTFINLAYTGSLVSGSSSHGLALLWE